MTICCIGEPYIQFSSFVLFQHETKPKHTNHEASKIGKAVITNNVRIPLCLLSHIDRYLNDISFSVLRTNIILTTTFNPKITLLNQHCMAL